MIRLTRPELTGALDQLKAVLESGFLVQGKHVADFESLVAGYVGRKHAVAASSGTSAIQCALLSLGIGEGDEVIIPDFTFPATANAVVCCGASPVPVDIDLATFNMDVGLIEDRLTPATRAIMPVDLFGLAADLGPIQEICRRRGLALVEDSACALGARYNDGMCGSFGDVSLLSFHPRKVITTGEGGMLLTDDDEIAGAARRIRNHGIEVSGGAADFAVAGHNMRMNELEACLGIVQMRRIDEMIAGRRRIAAVYDGLLRGVDGVTPPLVPDPCFHSYQSYVVMLEEGMDRGRLMKLMLDRGIETAIGTYAVHAQSFYRERPGFEADALTRSRRAYNQSLALPIYASMEENAVQRVAAVLKECIPGAAARK